MTLYKARLLIVEDEPALREVLAEELVERDLEVVAYAELPEVGSLPHLDYALLDLRVGGENSLSLITDLKTKFPQIKIVLMSGFGSVASAVKAMHLGADNFLTKPVTVDMILGALRDSTDLNEVPEEDISLARMEREYIDYIVQSSDGNISQAAKRLGLHRQSLQRKLRKYIPK